MTYKLPLRYFYIVTCLSVLIAGLWGQASKAFFGAAEVIPVVYGENEGGGCEAHGRDAGCTKALPLSMPAPLPGPVPKITLAVPSEGLVGEDFVFTVTFENPQGGTTGFAPAVDLILDAGGADHNSSSGPCDGITIVSAELTGVNGPALSLTPQTAAAPCGSPSALGHPFGGSPFGPVNVPASARMSTIVLPFGSYQSTQPKLTMTITAHIHDHADLGMPLFIYARGVYRFGADPLNNPAADPPIFSDAGFAASGWSEQKTITPVLFTIAKGFQGVEQETATGPNFPRGYEIVVDIAAGQTLSSLFIQDCLAPSMQYLGLNTAVTTPGFTISAAPAAAQPCLKVNYSTVTGAAGPDIKVAFNFFITDSVAGGPVLDPASCSSAVSADQASAEAKWTPIDPRDAQQKVQGSATDTVTDKRIAVKKSVKVVPTLPPGPLRPGRILQYTIDLDISDYFTVGKITVDDLLADGQDLLTTGTFAPTLKISDRRGPPTNVPLSMGAGIIRSLTPGKVCRGVTGGTTLLFQISQAMITNGSLFTAIPRQQGILTGGHAFLPVSNVPAAARIVYYAVIRDTYLHSKPTDKFVDKHDLINNCVTAMATIYANHPTAPKPIKDQLGNPVSCTDDSSTSVMLPGDVLEKKIVARNGSTTDPELAHNPPRFTAADTITFRLSKTLPAGDYEKLTIRDWAPLPALPLTNLVLDPLPCPSGVLPAAGHICRGSAHDLNVLPTLTTSAADNSLTLDYSSHHETSNLPKTIQLYVTLRFSADPYADGLFLTNVAAECEFNSLGTEFCQTATARFELTEPDIRIRKGIIRTDNPAGIFTPAPPVPSSITGVTQLTTTPPNSCGLPGSCPAIWTSSPAINSTMLANPNFFNSDLIADAGDWVTFAIVVENRGNGINGAFDIKIKDTPHPGFVSPALSYNLRAHNGAGTQINLSPAGITQLMTTGKDLLPIPSLDPFSPTGGKNIAIITYNMQLAGASSAQIGQCYSNTAELLGYTATHKGPNFVTAGFTPPFSDGAKVCLKPVLEKSIVATPEPHTTPQTSAAGTPDLAIGEIARYQLRVQLPEGTGPNFQVTDALPAGMKFMNDGSARMAFVSNGSGILHSFGSGFNVSGSQTIFPFSPSQPLTSGITVGANCGDDPAFNLGNIQNNDNDTDSEFVVIEFNALVCNVPANQSGATLTDTFSVTVAGNPAGVSNAVNAKVVESKLNVQKTALPVSVAPGGIVTFNISVTNSGSADAFDVSLADPMPGSSGLQLIGPVTLASSCSSPVLNSATNVVSVPRLPVGCAVTWTLQARVTAACPTPSVTNTVQAAYTSLPATGTPLGVSSPGPGGAVNGERQYSDSGMVSIPLICTTPTGCAAPPPKMVGWWPLDEQNGALTAADIASGNNGTQFSNGSPGPLATAVPGKVSGAKDFWSGAQISVPDTPALKLGTVNLSIDAWAGNQDPRMIIGIVDKLDIPAKKGYALYIENNWVKFVMGDGTTLTTFVSTTQTTFAFSVPSWHHIAVTVNRSGSAGGTFYIDGAPAGTFTPLANSVDIGASSDLLIGGSRLPFPPVNCVCEFRLDEVEIFSEAIAGSAIQAVYAAGPLGKCRP